MKAFVIINSVGMMINVSENVLIDKGYVIKDLFGIPVIVNANVINHVMLVNILIIKIVNVEKN